MIFPPPPFQGEIPPPLYCLHPAIGARPFTAGQPSEEPPQWWHELPDEVWEPMVFDWLRELLSAVAARGEGKLDAEFSDRRGREELMCLSECATGRRPASAICEATPTAIEALFGTNVSRFVQTVGDDVVLYASSWEEIFLCGGDEELLRRFGEPLLEPAAQASACPLGKGALA